MTLRDDQRARFARHLLLPELGEAGQQRLLASRVRFPRDAERAAREVAASYLARAGVHEAPEEEAVDALQVQLGDHAEGARIAGRVELEEAARSLVGALAAVETIKSLAGLGSPGARLPDGLLFAEDA
jgi:molybdopterin/thiamine biosynthesis adenylyltransferase